MQLFPSLYTAPPPKRANKDGRGRENLLLEPCPVLAWGPTPLASSLGLLPPSCGELALQSPGWGGGGGLGQQVHLRAETPGLEHRGVCGLRTREPPSHPLRGGRQGRLACHWVWASGKIRPCAGPCSQEQGLTLSKIVSNGAKVGENLLGSGRAPGLGVTGCGLGPGPPGRFLWAASISPSRLQDSSAMV